MQPLTVAAQITEITTRAITAGISVQQRPASIRKHADCTEVGALPGTSGTMRDISYADIYAEAIRTQMFHLRLLDGGLLAFQYKFDRKDELIKHRLLFLPCPDLPASEEHPQLYEQDDLYADLIQKQIVRFPIRFDYDPSSYSPRWHAHSHMTLGQFENCRIPASRPVSPAAFFLFIVRNFYSSIHRRNQNIFEKSLPKCHAAECITQAERGITSISVA